MRRAQAAIELLFLLIMIVFMSIGLLVASGESAKTSYHYSDIAELKAVGDGIALVVEKASAEKYPATVRVTITNADLLRITISPLSNYEAVMVFVFDKGGSSYTYSKRVYGFYSSTAVAFARNDVVKIYYDNSRGGVVLEKA